jgi:hypothetical protein
VRVYADEFDDVTFLVQGVDWGACGFGDHIDY